ncbi:hypothetical protein PM082_014424 [Marasmius tenuissimus]|nr:hypothetical protein PM082_014424 [Marasmius tenuissimus]
MHSIEGNPDTGARLQDAVASTLDRLRFGANGVLSNINDNAVSAGYYDGDMYLLRGLAEAYKRGEGVLSASLRDNLKILFGVHYNAIRDLATSGDGFYGREWRGPRPTRVNFDLYNQAAAAQILVDGIGIFGSSDDTPPPESPSASAESAKTKRPAAVIAGATVGAVILL